MGAQASKSKNEELKWVGKSRKITYVIFQQKNTFHVFFGCQIAYVIFMDVLESISTVQGCVNSVSCARARSKCDQEGPQNVCGALCVNSCKRILAERCLFEKL